MFQNTQVHTWVADGHCLVHLLMQSCFLLFGRQRKLCSKGNKNFKSPKQLMYAISVVPCADGC